MNRQSFQIAVVVTAQLSDFTVTLTYPEYSGAQIMKKITTNGLQGISFTAFVFSLFIMLYGMDHYSPILIFLFSFPVFLAAGLLLCALPSLLSPRSLCLLSGDWLSEKIDASCSGHTLKLFLWLFLFSAFFPTYLALFPGTFGYDTPVQAAQYFGEMPLTGANPLLHTYLLGTFLALGERLLGSAAAGLALFTLVQGLLITQVLAKSFLFLKNIHTPFTAIAAGLLWVLFNPTLHVLSFNATKDILFGVCLLHFLLALASIVYGVKKNDVNHEKKEYFRLILSGLFLCLMRNAAIYLTAAMVFVMFPAVRRFRKIILSLCVVFTVSWFISLLFSCGLDIPSGDTRENLSLPIQQLAAVNYAFYYETAPVSITKEQLDAATELIPQETFASFQPDTADPIKSAFYTDAFLADPQKYIALYLRTGIQNPRIYIRAFRNLTFPYLDMSKSIRRHLCLEETFPGISHVQISGYGLLPSCYRFLERQIETDHYFLLQPGLPIYLMIIGIGLSIGRRDLPVFLCILPVALYFLGLLLGPVALLRYLYPMMLAVPLLFGILFVPS